jgi:hypothetical protein
MEKVRVPFGSKGMGPVILQSGLSSTINELRDGFDEVASGRTAAFQAAFLRGGGPVQHDVGHHGRQANAL